jgi:hypothetical protein
MLLGLREHKAGFHVYPEQRLRVSLEPRYRIPDLCVMALPYEDEPVFTRPPHLVIEIISPDDEPADIPRQGRRLPEILCPARLARQSLQAQLATSRSRRTTRLPKPVSRY